MSGGGVATRKSYPSRSGKQGQTRPGRLAGAEYAKEALLVAERVAGDEARVVQQFGVPARPSAARVARGVPAVAGDFGVGVAGIGPDGDPAPRAGRSPVLHRARWERAGD